MLHIAPQVLVLDDDAAICGVVEEALADDGWDVQTRTRGWAALEFLQRRAVDVILLDLRLRDMEPETFLALCREQGVGDTPVILLSAASGLDRHADRLGVSDWLAKPFNINDLCSIVGKYVSQDQGDGGAVRRAGAR